MPPIPLTITDYISIVDPSYDFGSSPPAYCNKQTGDMTEMLPSLTDEHIKTLASKMNDSKCKTSLNVQYSTLVDEWRAEVYGAAEYDGFVAGGDASIAGGKATENMAASTGSEGCITSLFNEFTNLRMALQSVCKSYESKQLISAKDTTNLSLVVESSPTPEQSKIRAQELADYKESFNLLVNNTTASDARIKFLMDSLREAERARIANYSFKLSNAQISVLLDNSTELISTNNMAISNEASYKEVLESTLETQLKNDLQQTYGLGAGPLGDISELLSTRVKNAKEEKFDDIIKLANEHKIEKQADGSLKLLIRGPIDHLNLKLTAKNMTFIRADSIQKSINTLAKDMSEKLVFDIMNNNVTGIDAKGLDDLQKQIGDSMDKIAKTMKPPSLLGEGGLGGLLGGGGMIFLVIFLLLFSGGGGGGIGMKIVLVLLVVLAAYVGAAYMFSWWPFKSKKEDFSKQYKTSRRYPYDSSNKFKTRTTPNVEYLTSRMGTRKKIKTTPYKR